MQNAEHDQMEVDQPEQRERPGDRVSLGMLLIHTSLRRQRLGDRLAGTVVVGRAAFLMNEDHGPPPEALLPSQMSQEEYEACCRQRVARQQGESHPA